MPESKWIIDNGQMTEEKNSGFTLIELLIVISIMSVLSLFGFLILKSLIADQSLLRFLGEIQTQLQLHISNSTNSVNCATSGGTSWSVKFKPVPSGSASSLDLICGSSGTVVKTQNLENVHVLFGGDNCLAGSLLEAPFTVTYSALSGKVSFIGGSACIASSQTITLDLTNIKSKAKKTFSISTGGAIDVQ